MKLLDRIINEINRIIGFRHLESESDELILRVTNLNPKHLPQDWRKAARLVLEDLYWINDSELNHASAAIIKLAYFCHGFKAIHDTQNHDMVASAIRKLRTSSEGADISCEASKYSYSFAGT